MRPIYLEGFPIEGPPVEVLPVPEVEIITPGPRTDGGKIVVKGKVVAEQNHSKTCLATNVLSMNCLLVAEASKSLAKLLAAKKGVLITGANGNATFIQVPSGDAGKNKILATDANSNLVWVDQ